MQFPVIDFHLTDEQIEKTREWADKGFPLEPDVTA